MPSNQASLDHVVAIGASAGGLEAIQDLISHLPVEVNVAYIIAQHLAPDHPSQLADLLVRSTRLKVVTAADGMALEPGRIVVLPPNGDATVEEGILRIREPQPRFGPSPSVDLLFTSLADAWGDRAVAVVLSGTGSDGACGLRAVTAAGGLTLVQSPESARFDGMPRAALALGGADLVADPAVIAARLGAWFGAMDPDSAPALEASESLLLSSALAQIKQVTGIDFSGYKQSTLQRQLQRRMAIRGVQVLEDYLPLLVSDAGEGQALAHNLLVNVTQFFRNPEAFEELGRHLQPLIAGLPADQCLRVWVPGCATGEEVYSLAMIVSEAMGHPTDLSQHLKVFATDLDEQALAVGRRAIYPLSAAKSIPAPLLQRFGLLRDHDFEISKDLRACILFAKHNIAEDSPFPDLDLISCRNTLIYFTAPLQERVIDLFRFSLQSGGLLFLGNSESLSRLSGFSVINPVHRIYRRAPGGRLRRRLAPAMTLQLPPPLQRPAAGVASVRESVPEQHIKLLEALSRTLLPPALVLDENHNLVEVLGDVSPYCRLPEGRMPAAAGAFLRDELQSEARALFLLVRADQAPASSSSLQLGALESPVRLDAAPLQVGDRVFTVLSFNALRGEAPPPPTGLPSPDRDAAFAQEIERLERELLSSQDTLRRSMADLEQVNEELEASSEELQASSEELQSSNEELEASNEELQATNEELSTLNQQLRSRSDELEQLNTDLENIQSSLSQGMVIVDRQLRITRFTPLAVRVFGLVDSDIGQPLIGMPTTVPLPDLREALLAVVNGEERRSIEATSEEVSYLAQVMPYRDRLGLRLGAIITLTDVSEQVALRRAAEASLREFASLADALDQVVWKRDRGMSRILYISQRIQELTGWSSPELCADPGLLDRAIFAEDRAAVEAARGTGGLGWSVTFRLRVRDGRERAFQEVASVLEESSHQEVVGTLTEVTEVRLLERRHALLACAFEAIQAEETRPIALLDDTLRLVNVSGSFASLLARPANALQGQPLASLKPALALLAEQEQASQGAPAVEPSLHQLVEEVICSRQPAQRQALLLSSQAPRSVRVRLDLLPLGHSGQGLGVLLQLHLPAPD